MVRGARRPVFVRQPTAEERQAATRLATLLRKVTYPSRAKTKVRSVAPPGRVNMRGAMQQTQQRQTRAPMTAEPFTRVQRAKTIHTPLKVGIMCDISGSMSRAQEPLAVARWVLADALHQVNGEVAVVLFGSEGEPIQAPRERVPRIEVHDADGGYENFVDGFSLVDAALDLIDGDGARLLVIITDGHFCLQDAVQYAEVVMDMCKRSGVAVVWLDISNYFARPDLYGFGTLVQAAKLPAVKVAELLGDAVVEEFRRSAIQHSLMA